MAFEPSSPDHEPVNGGEYLKDGGHQAGLEATGMSVGMSLKYALNKIIH